MILTLFPKLLDIQNVEIPTSAYFMIATIPGVSIIPFSKWVASISLLNEVDPIRFGRWFDLCVQRTYHRKTLAGNAI